jgi:hypothetical protein
MNIAYHVETAAFNAWPGLQTYLYDGWVIRLANGYTKRANSVTPLYSGELELTIKIDYCEALFKRSGQAAVFRLPAFTNPEVLDTELAARGYKRIDETSVQVLDLSWSGALSSERAFILPDRSGLESWLGSFHQMNVSRTDPDTHRQLLQNALGQKCPMVLMVDSEVVCCGIAVADGGYCGLFDIVTAVDQRQKGYGRELTESLLDWAINAFAHTAYLQVMVNNIRANRLYANLGFKEIYRYWYRVKEF